MLNIFIKSYKEQANEYVFKVNYKNTRRLCEMY